MNIFDNACLKGDKKTVLSLINKGVDYNWGLAYACEGGHKEIIETMIFMGANAFNRGLAYACYRGRREIVELMISKGADDFNCLRRELLGAQHGISYCL